MKPIPFQKIGSSHATNDWRVDIGDGGRTGSVVYTEPAGSVVFTWEFGGGDTVAILYLGDPLSAQYRRSALAGFSRNG